MISKNLLYVALVSLWLPLIAFAQQQNEYAEGQAVLKVVNPFTTIETVNGIVSTEQSWFNSLADQYQISELKPIFESPNAEFDKYYLAVFDSTYTVDEVVNAFTVESEVEYAEPDYIFIAFGTPNDPFFNLQWGLSKIEADLAWDIESGNSSVVVGVVDTGTDLLDDGGSPHPDLINNLWNGNGIYGWNTVIPGQLPDDDNGHGSHVAGIIAAETNNNTGVAGMAGGGFGVDDGIRIMSVKGLRLDGIALAHQAAPAIVWAADPDGDPATDDGADIINMSWGRIIDPGNLIRDAIQYANSLGVVLIASAGNNSDDLDAEPVFPAIYDEVWAVAGTDVNDLKIAMSNFGSPIEVCAPAGPDLYSQIDDNIISTTPFDPGFYLNSQLIWCAG
ncbi:MAG: S8 family serine peptidase [Aliifodinibius sp.]|nr:S8 family serine peptidase [Fodinibius sp.]NIV11801.1 S8 family serine peptidase [Fodinibius sp.]NIY25437.1 S8 family serine peptidase [Fodinibius sp.]